MGGRDAKAVGMLANGGNRCGARFQIAEIKLGVNDQHTAVRRRHRHGFARAGKQPLPRKGGGLAGKAGVDGR